MWNSWAVPLMTMNVLFSVTLEDFEGLSAQGKPEPSVAASLAPSVAQEMLPHLEKAKRRFGDTTSSRVIPGLKQVSLPELEVPFLTEELGNRFTRALSIDSHIEFKSLLPSGQQLDRVFDLFFHPDTGSVFMIRSVKEDDRVGIPPIPAGVAAEQMRRSGEEVYHGFPSEDPPVSFQAALAALHERGGPVTRAKQIVGHYVTWSRMGRWREPRSVWAITLLGIPPVHSTIANPPEIFWYRYIVDAKTGRLLCGSNTPRPVDYAPFSFSSPPMKEAR